MPEVTINARWYVNDDGIYEYRTMLCSFQGKASESMIQAIEESTRVAAELESTKPPKTAMKVIDWSV